MNDIEKLLKDKLASQGIDKAWLDSHLEVLTDDDDEEDNYFQTTYASGRVVKEFADKRKKDEVTGV